jgi:hypothetical protein
MDILGELLARTLAEIMFRGITTPPGRWPRAEDFNRPPEKSIYEIRKNNSTLFVNPLEKIKVYRKGETFNPTKFQCSHIQDIQTTSEGDFVADKKEFDYALERLMVQTDKLKGNTLQITKVEKDKMEGKVFDCKTEEMKK